MPVWTPKQILSLSSTSSPNALVLAQLNPDNTYGGGVGYGRAMFQQVFLQVTRAGGSAMTGVTFKVQGARNPLSPSWFDIPFALITDPAGTLATTQTLSASAGTTVESAVISQSLIGIPAVRVLAQAVVHDAIAGDSCAAWVWA